MYKIIYNDIYLHDILAFSVALCLFSQLHLLCFPSFETILVPSYAEQQKIGAYFRNLDQQISLQTQRLEKIKQIKAACLDKMFV